MRLCVAIGISILIHGLIAFALIAYLEYAPHPDVLATLDLASVELSFAEKAEETAAVAPMPPSPAAQSESKPSQDENPPAVKPEKPLAPKMGEIKFPEPKEDVKLKAKKDEKRKPRDAKPTSTPAIAPRQARVDAPPRPKRTIRPDYPKGARQRGEQGEVVLEIRVNANGVVDDVKVAVSSGFAEIDAAAVKAAKVAKFNPARSGSDAIASAARLKLQFRLK